MHWRRPSGLQLRWDTHDTVQRGLRLGDTGQYLISTRQADSKDMCLATKTCLVDTKVRSEHSQAINFGTSVKVQSFDMEATTWTIGPDVASSRFFE